MENNTTSKSARRKLFFTRCGIFAILLLMLLPMLCSAAPPPNPTDSLINTWTSITNWVISSLNTVQGVFISRGSGVMLNDYLDMSNTITYDGYTLAYANYNNFPDGDLYYGNQNITTDQSGMSEGLITIDGLEYTVVYINGIPLQLINLQTGLFFNTALDLSIGAPAGGYELTLLGTLAVIGVSIAVCFLLIGIIQRFLKLRG